MKSYFLTNTEGRDHLQRALDELLPLQRHPWVMLGTDGDTMCYINIDNSNGFDVQLDVSGRHYDRDADFLKLLKSLRTLVGGVITDNDDNVID